MSGVGFEGQHSRLRTIKTFLSKPPAGAKTLTLTVCATQESPLLRLGEYTIDVIVPALADELLAMATDHLAEADVKELQFILSFVRETGDVIASKPFKVRREAMVSGGSSADDVAAKFDGSDQSRVALNMRETHALTRLYISAHQVQLQQQINSTERAMSGAERAAERIDTAYATADRLRAENESLRDELNALREAIAHSADHTPPDPENPAQLKALALLEKYLPMMLMKAAQAKSGTSS